MFNELYHLIYASKLSVIIAAIPIIVLVWSVIGALFSKWIRVIALIATVIVLSLVVYASVISREIGYKGTELIPFSSFARAVERPEMYRSMLMNVFFFIPFGLFLPYVFCGSTTKRVWLTILLGFLLSVTIEVVQYLFTLGLAETDDVICNTLGTLIGSCSYLLSVLWMRIMKKPQERR